MIKKAQYDVIIIGAGIAGLVAAVKLKQNGARVIVLEKGRGVGGRMATRRTSMGVFDHGAQFFTSRDEPFRSMVAEFQAQVVVKNWSTGFAFADGKLKEDGENRFCGVHGMTEIAKHLARDVEVRCLQKVTLVARQGDGWGVTAETGDLFTGQALMLTSPVPQSLNLLAASELVLPDVIAEELGQIKYAPCLALLVQLPKMSRIPPPGGLWLDGSSISWMGDNEQKGISSGSSITIHANPQFSRNHWNASEEEITSALLAQASPWLGSIPLQTQLHRWLYSLPLQKYYKRCVILHLPAPLVFAGDAFGGPRVEGAALSGLAAGESLVPILAKRAGGTEIQELSQEYANHCLSEYPSSQ